ncbi:MAG TPA: prepilin-type N-terminal cleavage/methylation domain-containing protein [Phycisphaerae bacterium]|nr:prepilin-type N-terminal cleavage/methylation domain-containing protein [Phycisphaerae bacterium]
MKTFKVQFSGNPHGKAAFTLIELLVTISIIALVLGIAGPTAMRMFTSSSDTQAYNMFSTQLSLARAQAIESANYVGLHCQIADDDKTYVKNYKLADKCITAIVAYDSGVFDLKTGEQPQEVPGNIAFGQIDTTYVSSGDYNTTVGSDMDNFTTFTILFNCDGEITQKADNGNISFKSSSALFDSGTTSTGIWSLPTAEQGVTCVTMFDYITFKNKSTDTLKKNYLNEAGQFIAANVYTGRLFDRE